MRATFAQTWVDPQAWFDEDFENAVYRRLRAMCKKTAVEGNCRVIYYHPPTVRWDEGIQGNLVRVQALVKEAPNAHGN
jgi:hypothetical protein